MKATKQAVILTSAIVLSLFNVNCSVIQNANNKQKGGAIGAAGGAVIGAIIGNNIGKGGNGELGAVIGGVLGGSAGILIGSKMDKQAQEIKNEVPGAQVERVDDAIVLTFEDGSGIYFDTNKFDINSASRTTLNKLTVILKDYPDTNILVVGHTDSVGSEEYNMELSKNRAYSVTNFLINNEGLPSSRLSTNWFGEQQPLHNNESAEGRAKNRRVNIVILPNEKMKKQAIQEAGR
jgi:outer membrane protein OmpA-like peptidoglycan-associated protein